MLIEREGLMTYAFVCWYLGVSNGLSYVSSFNLISVVTIQLVLFTILAGLKEKYDKAMRRNDVKAIVVIGMHVLKLSVAI